MGIEDSYAGLQSEKEPEGILLPQRSEICLPALVGYPAALDFAVTAPQRQETLALAGREMGVIGDAYDRDKEDLMITAHTYESQGVVFVPMIEETTGIWEKGEAIVLRLISRAVVSRLGEEPDAIHVTLFQELCVLVRGFRTRAAMRRRSEVAV